MGLSSVGNIFSIIREIDLGQIKATADRPFRLLVLGDYLLATELATKLSAEIGKSGIHPWIYVSTDGAWTKEGVPVVAAVMATPHVEPDAPDMMAFQELTRAGVPLITVVVNEMASHVVGSELPRREEAKRVVVPVLTDDNVHRQVIPVLTAVIPLEWQVAVARQLPPLRPLIAQSLIEETSRANGVYATTTAVGEAIPGLNIALTAADMIVLTKNQLVMAYKIALAAGKEGKPMDVMGEVVSVVGGGFLLRQLARELVGLIPVVGAIPKIAVAYAGTWVMGRTVTLWALEGHRLNPSEARRFYDEALTRGRRLAENLLEKIRREEPAALPGPASGGTEVAVQPKPKRGWLERLRARFRQARPDDGAHPRDENAAKRWWQRLPFFGSGR